MNAVDRKKLRADAHALNPVVIIGQAGLTDAVLAEIELALDYHELIKIKVRAEREDRQPITSAICQHTGAELIQTIGQVVVIYRLNPAK